MGLEVSRDFEKQYNKLDPQTQRSVMSAFEKLAANPQSVQFEEKTGNAKGIFTIRVEGGNRVAFTKNADGNLVPAFVGNHREYDQFLARPRSQLSAEHLLGEGNSRVRTMDLNIPESLRTRSLLRSADNFSLGNIRFRGVAGAAISIGIGLAVTGSPQEAIASTTPGHVGMELYQGDIRGATEALIVDGAGDIGCVAAGAGGAKLLGGWGTALGPWGTAGGAIIGGLGGCLIGSIIASETAQAAWNALVEKDPEIADPVQKLNELKRLGIENIPATASPDMPQSLRDLVYYRNQVSSAVDNLNQAAQNLARNPQDEAAKKSFVEATSSFSQAAEAYKISATTQENPQVIQAYLERLRASSAQSAPVEMRQDFNSARPSQPVAP